MTVALREDMVLHAGDDGYQDAVTTVTGVGTPDIVVRPRSTADVVDALLYARQEHMPLTVRSGGHNLAGLTQVSDGMLIDMRRMNAVERVGVSSRVRIGGGATWGEVAKALSSEGLALTAGDTADVGVAGLTLGGGIGWMVREYGLSIDSLVSVELVTADGEVLEVSDSEHPDLFWAVRGGGGNFGVLTRLEFEAHPVDKVVFGTVLFALDSLAEARPVVSAWERCQRDADRRLTSVLALMPAMQDSPAMAMLQYCFDGDEDEAAPHVEALSALGTVMHKDIQYRPYASILVQDDPFPAPAAAQRNVLLSDFGKAEQSAVCDAFETGQLMMAIRALGGAMADVPPAATAFSARNAAVMVIGTQLLAPGDDRHQPMPGWEGIEHRGGESYVNWLDFADATASRRAYSEDALLRLARIKAQCDPNDVFSKAVPLVSE
jgi:FAD/FMN-containing dehydrogenase